MLTKDDLKEVLEDTLDQRMGMDSHLHQRHHDFINAMIDEREERKARNNKIKVHVIGWGVITTIGAAGYAIWETIKRATH